MWDEVEVFLRAGRAAWPRIALDDGVVLARVREIGAVPPIDHAGDLYLACACAAGIPAALEALEHAVFDRVMASIRRIDPSPAFVAEASQAVRARLLVGPAPKIREYAGRAALATWISTVAVRTALDLQRGATRQPPDEVDELDARNAPVAERLPPELEALRARHAHDLDAALRDALASMSVRDRTLLRLHLIEDMSIDRLARFYRIERSTASRWLAAARRTLAERTRHVFCARVAISPSEFDSLAGALRNEIDLSLSRELRDTATPGREAS